MQIFKCENEFWHEEEDTQGPDKPKRPLSAFLVFMDEFRKKFKEENPSNKSVTVVGIAAGENWKQLSDADKAPYVAEAENRMAEYQKNMNAYKEAASQKSIDAYNKLRGLAMDLDKPKMPESGFSDFMVEYFGERFLGENSNKFVSVVSKSGEDKWKQMSDAEKAPYLARAQKRKPEYEKTMQTYLRRKLENIEESARSEVDEEERIEG